MLHLAPIEITFLIIALSLVYIDLSYRKRGITCDTINPIGLIRSAMFTVKVDEGIKEIDRDADCLEERP